MPCKSRLKPVWRSAGKAECGRDAAESAVMMGASGFEGRSGFSGANKNGTFAGAVLSVA
jgi:hypothetical protein